jgi:peptidyl-prolyl cis-trans isomerase A (cyclophilin A)
MRALLALMLVAAAPAAKTPVAKAGSGLVQVRLETTAGPITVAVDTKHAPLTANNFLAYVDEHRFDGTTFYRSANSKRNPADGLLQGGINHRISNSRFPIAHEPTSKTGLHHVDGTLSMARNAPGTAMGDFFIIVGNGSYLDAKPNYPGYAAFGHVVSGMPVVKKIMTGEKYPGGWDYNTIGQSLVHPVKIVRAVRVR